MKNYRSHEAILRYPNEKFYDSELEVCGAPTTINAFLRSAHLVSPTFPVVFHAISGENERESSSVVVQPDGGDPGQGVYHGARAGPPIPRP